MLHWNGLRRNWRGNRKCFSWTRWWAQRFSVKAAPLGARVLRPSGKAEQAGNLAVSGGKSWWNWQKFFWGTLASTSLPTISIWPLASFSGRGCKFPWKTTQKQKYYHRLTLLVAAKPLVKCPNSFKFLRCSLCDLFVLIVWPAQDLSLHSNLAPLRPRAVKCLGQVHYTPGIRLKRSGNEVLLNEVEMKGFPKDVNVFHGLISQNL